MGAPEARAGHVMAYDSDRGVIVMFGGHRFTEDHSDFVYFNDTWEYDGISWRRITIDGPVPLWRTAAAMCYDSVRKEMLLVGGFNIHEDEDDGFLRDTWVFRPTTPGHGVWTRKADIAINPFGASRSPHAGHALVFDYRRGLAVMMGGTTGEDPHVGKPDYYRTSDVVHWGGESWGYPTELFGIYSANRTWYEGPTFHAMVYDDDTGLISVSGGAYYYFLDTDDWLDLDWDGVLPITRYNGTNLIFTTINRRQPIGGTPIGHRQQHAAVYDSVRHKMVIFGGRLAGEDTQPGLEDPGGRLDEASYYQFPDGEPTYQTTRLNIPTPPPRELHTMVYDAHRKRVVLFGGSRLGMTVFNDTWEYTEVPLRLDIYPGNTLELCEGQSTVFTVAGSDSRAKTVQWYHGSTALDGQTNVNFMVSNAAPIHVGDYFARAVDECNNVYTSAVTRLIVHTPPVITGQILERIDRCPGDALELRATVHSTLPVSLQWYLRDDWNEFSTPIVGATNSTLVLPVLHHEDSGSYVLRAATRCHTNSSPIAWVQVGVTIPVPPVDRVKQVCDGHLFQIFAAGIGQLRYQWRLDGAPLSDDENLSGAKSNRLVIPHVLYTHDGNYDVIVTDDCGPQHAVTSRVARLTVTPGPQWVFRTNNAPPPPSRFHHAMAYDSSRHVTVMFGGYFHSPTNFGAFNDLWEWNGTQWTQRVPQDRTNAWSINANGYWFPNYSNAPVQRAEHAMTYDPRRGRIIIFGGTAVDPGGSLYYLNDTWEWDGGQWYFRGTNGPAWRSAAGMTFDTARNVSVLFGGSYASADPAPGARWEWDGTSWKTNATFGNFAPNANTIGLVYDSFRNNFLYGPTPNISGFVFEYFWLLNGSNWTAHGGAFNLDESPAPYGNLVFDSYRRRGTYTFGTKGSVGFWDGRSWAVYTNLPAPQLRFWHSAAFDSDRRAVVMFGGTFGNFNSYFVNTNDTWELIYLDKPLIQQQPLSQIRQLNDNATFSVTAVGPGPLTYQWLRNGQPLANDLRISGATSNVLSLASVSTDDETLFQVRITGACGATLSRPALLTLNTNLQIASAAGELQVIWNESNAVLEQADDPAGPWTPVHGAFSPFNPSLAATLKFYRLRLLPP